MSEPAPLQVRDALQELVNQFADPMSFLRELVQNAVDAGSEEIEVFVEWEAGARGEGVTVIRLDDWGEGMTREIIEKKLTRLFSSGKDGDKTKIGKFGIGFVSVFALAPQAVCVDTAREGESWRVLFDAERRFKLIRRSEPVDGTKIRILKKTTKEEHDTIARRAGEVLTYWCKHVGAEIRYQGKSVHQPFGLPDAVVEVEQDDGFSKIVVGHRAGPESFAGFYNSGLTLIETTDLSLPGIAYKASSPHLEHTLTRDNIIHDAGYERVMGQVRQLVAGPLCDRAVAMLGERLEDEGPRAVALVRAVCRHAVMGHLARHPNAVLARSPGGADLTVARLRGSHEGDRVLLARQRMHLTDALERARHTVLLDRVPAATPELLAALLPSGTTHVAVDELYCLPRFEDSEDPGAAGLAEAVRRLLREDGAKVGDIAFGRFDYAGSRIGERIAIAQAELGEPTPLTDATQLGRGLFSRARSLAINASHPGVAPLLRLAPREPEFAAYVLVKQFLLGTALDAEQDTRLLRAGLERRWRRSTT